MTHNAPSADAVLTADLPTPVGWFTPGHPVHVIRHHKGRAVVCVVHTDRCHKATVPAGNLITITPEAGP